MLTSNDSSVVQYFAYVEYFKQFEELSQRQVVRLLQQIRMNNQGSLNKLILHTMTVVGSVVNRYFRSCCFNGIEPLDLLGEGYIAVYQGILAYNPNKAPYSWYMRSYICGCIKHKYSKLKSMIQGSKEPVPIDSLDNVAFDNGEDAPITLAEIVPDTKEIETQKIKESVDEILSYTGRDFSKQERKLFEMKFGVGRYKYLGPLSYDEMEKRNGQSRETIRLLIEKRILPLLRKTMINGNPGGEKNAAGYKVSSNNNCQIAKRKDK